MSSTQRPVVRMWQGWAGREAVRRYAGEGVGELRADDGVQHDRILGVDVVTGGGW